MIIHTYESFSVCAIPIKFQDMPTIRRQFLPARKRIVGAYLKIYKMSNLPAFRRRNNYFEEVISQFE